VEDIFNTSCVSWDRYSCPLGDHCIFIYRKVSQWYIRFC